MIDRKMPGKSTLEADCLSGLLQSEIANKYGIAAAYVGRTLKKYGLKTIKHTESASYKARLSAAIKKKHTEPGYTDKALKSARTVFASGVKSNSEIQSLSWSGTALRQKHSSLMKNVVSTDEYKSKMQQIYSTDEFRTRLAKQRSSIPKTFTKPHQKVCEILSALNIEFKTEHQIGPYNFDIFIEDKNILIEVNGDYWHNLPDQKTRDKSKAAYISNNFPSLSIKYIWEHECLQEERIQYTIESWVSRTIQQVDFKLNDVEISLSNDNKEVDQFLYRWHYQYNGRKGVDIIARHDGKLISIARFCPVSRQGIAVSEGLSSNNTLELSRFCIHPAYHKRNFATYFLSRVRKVLAEHKPNITHLISFADSTYNHVGTIYKADNWEMVSTVYPDYWYVDTDGWAMHKKTLYEHAKKMSQKESEYAESLGYIKVYGKEKYKFLRKIS